MANVNKVILIGNVTRDPEVKFTSKGSAVADLGLAINRNYTLDNGEKREETTFVDVELWGRLAEIAGEYAKKGRPVYIEGRLRMDTWDDKASGQKRSRMKVVGDVPIRRQQLPTITTTTFLFDPKRGTRPSRKILAKLL